MQGPSSAAQPGPIEQHPDVVWAGGRLHTARRLATVGLAIVAALGPIGALVAYYTLRPPFEFILSGAVWAFTLFLCFRQRRLAVDNVRDFSLTGRQLWRRTVALLWLEFAVLAGTTVVQLSYFAITGQIVFSVFYGVLLALVAFPATSGALLDAAKTVTLVTGR